MGQTVLVANGQAAEARAVVHALGERYHALPVSNMAALLRGAESAEALVLDTNFTECMGLDALMNVLSRVHVPVLMITPVEGAHCALEALRCGAAGYLVKTGRYMDLLPLALQDAVQKINTMRLLKSEIVEQRRRIGELEALTGAHAIPADDGDELPVPEHALNGTSALEAAVAARLRSGTLQLPAYPQVALKLRELLHSDVGVGEIAQLLSQDAAVSAKLLRVANAAQFANARKVESIEGAVSRIGLLSTCNIAEMIANRSLYTTRNMAYRKILDDLWLHSIACAHACEAIARRTEKAVTPKLFSLGLLHDCGMLALLQTVSQLDPDGKRIATPEDEASFRLYLRQQNAKCGTVLMQCWNFDDEFLQVVRHHEDIKVANHLLRPVLIVNLADLIVRSRGYGAPLDSPSALAESPAKGFLLPETDEMDDIYAEIDKAVEETRRLLS